MHHSVKLLATLVLLTTIAGCSGDTSNLVAPSASDGTTITADPTTGTWRLSSIQPTGQAEQSVPSGATYELAFAEGRVSTKADCNICNGAFSVNGQTVTVGPRLACTLAACPTMAFENTYVGILAGDSTARLDGTSLTLSSSRGLLRFRR